MNLGKPPVIALMGLPGCGKSSLARALAAILSWPIVDRDAIRSAMFGNYQFDPQSKVAANAGVEIALRAHCDAGRACLIDGMTFAAEADRAAIADAVPETHALQWWLVDVPTAEARRRVAADWQAQRHSSPERTPDLVDAVAARFAPLPADAERLDANQGREKLLYQALDLLGHPAAQGD